MIELIRRIFSTPQGMIGSILVVFLVLVCIFGPMIAPFDPETMHFGSRFAKPGAAFWFGTDHFGRDIFSRLLNGARQTLGAAVAATILGTAVGAAIGLISSYLGGRWDEAIMRTMDALKAMPSLILALLIVSMLGSSRLNAMLAIAITFVPSMVRITRSVGLVIRQQAFVSAAIARGEGTNFIVFREMLPNAAAPIVIEATIRVAFAVMMFATMSFLGLGTQPPASDWGLMAAEARPHMFQAPWSILAPCAAIAVTAIGFNLFGDGLRDALNPREG